VQLLRGKWRRRIVHVHELRLVRIHMALVRVHHVLTMDIHGAAFISAH